MNHRCNYPYHNMADTKAPCPVCFHTGDKPCEDKPGWKVLHYPPKGLEYIRNVNHLERCLELESL